MVKQVRIQAVGLRLLVLHEPPCLTTFCAELRAHMGRPGAILVVTAQRPATLQPRMEPEFLRIPRTVPCGEGCGGSYASLAWVISVLP